MERKPRRTLRRYVFLRTLWAQTDVGFGLFSLLKTRCIGRLGHLVGSLTEWMQKMELVGITYEQCIH